MRVSGWCLDGVWGCLDGVWMGSESVWGCINTRMSGYQDVAIPNPLAKFKLGHTRILPFLSVPSIAKTSMSGGVWMVSEGVWMVSEGVWGGINTKSVGKIIY